MINIIKTPFMKGLGILALLLTLASCGSQQNITILQGAGATFPYPLYAKMFSEYHKEFGVQINYQAIGSGGGIRQLKNKTVDFGASDAFMKDSALTESENKILHIPICLGAVALSYNLPTVSELKLTPEVLSNIFLGKIKTWNDAAIKQLNPNTTLPNLNIVTVHRSDGSGTTFIFSDYLSKVSAAWLNSVGRGKSLNWPVGLGGKGNAGVAGLVKQTPGAIGYIGSVYAAQNKMAMVSLENKRGNFILPSLASISEAANTEIPADTRASVTDSLAKNGYPISGFTWILAYQDQSFNDRTIEQAQATKTLLKWMITDGQRFATPLNFSPLTDSTAKKALTIVNSMTFSGTTLK
jgi:phosphate transport system substrate-binding protein